MGRAQREKGQRGELEAVHALAAIYPDAHRGMQAQGGTRAADVEGTPWHVECKRHRRHGVMKHLRQAESDAGDGGRPALVWLREDGDTSAAVLLRWDMLLELLRRLGGAV